MRDSESEFTIASMQVSNSQDIIAKYYKHVQAGEKVAIFHIPIVRLGSVQKSSVCCHNGILGKPAVKVLDLLKLSPSMQKRLQKKLDEKKDEAAAESDSARPIQAAEHELVPGDAAVLEGLARLNDVHDEVGGEEPDDFEHTHEFTSWVNAHEPLINETDKKEMKCLSEKLARLSKQELDTQRLTLEASAQQLELSQGLTPEEAALEVLMTTALSCGGHGLKTGALDSVSWVLQPYGEMLLQDARSGNLRSNNMFSM